MERTYDRADERRRAAQPLPHTPVPSVAWQVTDFVLFESREQRYLDRARWPLD